MEKARPFDLQHFILPTMSESRVLITGFQPFGGRACNSSWEGIKWINEPGLLVEELPVVWGQPSRRLGELVDVYRPSTVISFGQGKEREFTLETKALNLRDNRLDEQGNLPRNPLNSDMGPNEVFLETDVFELHGFLSERNFPVRISDDAGQYLCEETIYKLSELQKASVELEKVFFCHVPPYGTSIEMAGHETEVNAVLLREYVRSVLSCLGIPVSKPN